MSSDSDQPVISHKKTGVMTMEILPRVCPQPHVSYHLHVTAIGYQQVPSAWTARSASKRPNVGTNRMKVAYDMNVITLCMPWMS